VKDRKEAEKIFVQLTKSKLMNRCYLNETIESERILSMDKIKYFQTDDVLVVTINQMTTDVSGKFQRRDFVEHILEFCTDNCYNGKVGIVYGIRSTGKTVGIASC
jgi:hypothetical protein